MASLQYRSSKANPPSIASIKTRKAMQNRIILRVQANQLDLETGKILYNLAAVGHCSKAVAYGYHPTKARA